MRSAIGGCVENILESPWPGRKGFAIIMWLAVSSRGSGGSGSCFVPASSLRRALARASGSPVSWAPEASASYSRERLTASWMTDGGQRAQDHDQQHAEEAGAVVVVRAADRDQPGEVHQEHDHRGERSGDRGDQDVAVVDMAQLVADDAAQLALVEDAQDALGAADRRVARVAAGGEGVGCLASGEMYRRGMGWRACVESSRTMR